MRVGVALDVTGSRGSPLRTYAARFYPVIKKQQYNGKKRLEISVRRTGTPNRCSPLTLCLIGLPIECRVKKRDPAKKKIVCTEQVYLLGVAPDSMLIDLSIECRVKEFVT